MKTEKRKLGDLGEELACRFLVKHGYEIVERNYLKKWGEIDIVAKKEDVFHFVEVKTVTRDLESITKSSLHDSYRAEDNIHPWKLKRLERAIETYLLENSPIGGKDPDWQMDAIITALDPIRKKTQVEMIENIF